MSVSRTDRVVASVTAASHLGRANAAANQETLAEVVFQEGEIQVRLLAPTTDRHGVAVGLGVGDHTRSLQVVRAAWDRDR